MAQSLNDPNSPFVNRAISAYNVGSVYKMVVCAAALKSGIGPDFTYTCVGAIDVGGQVFYCHDHAGHGELTMKEALEESCNPYFIKLGLEVGGDAILAMANRWLWPGGCAYTGLQTASGSLPQSEDLQLNAALANFSFGQGDLTATPLQIAKYLTVFANHGKMVVPQLVLGQVDENGKLVEKQESYMPRPVVDYWIADTIANYMVTAVEEGSGKRAKPEYFGAGGKTGSAQTGIYNEDGEEIVHAWFGGFFPVEQPQYVCVVLVEGGDSGALVAAPIFKEIADAIAKNAMG